MTRAYDNSRREEAAARTRDRILGATESLLLGGPVAAITLQAIAAAAGVTVQTVLRHVESREGCLLAVASRVAARVESQRGLSAPGDTAGALAGLLTHYETDGRLILALLAQAPADPVAREWTDAGRAFHRAWVERCFGPALPAVEGATERQLAVDALVAATDLYVWKLLRVDLGRSAAETALVIGRLAHAVTA